MSADNTSPPEWEKCLLKSTNAWAYGKEKIRGAERNLPDFFGLCPRCQKNFPEKLSKIVVDGGGGGGGSDYEKFLLDSIFPTIKIDRISHKIDRIFPIYFYNKPILPDCEANIARLALFAQKIGGGGAAAPPPPPPARYAHGPTCLLGKTSATP
jgi:hypothetical protein